MFGDMFEDEEEDYSLNSFTAGGTGGIGRRALGKPPDPRPSSGFVGLLNQGATCYLNSLIQALYMTPELRAGLYELTLDDLQVVTAAPQPQPAAEAKSDDVDTKDETGSEAKVSEEPDLENPTTATTTREEGEEDEQPTAELGGDQSTQGTQHSPELVAESTTEVVKDADSDANTDRFALLSSMGFDEASVRRAIARFPQDQERAVEWLISGAALEDDTPADEQPEEATEAAETDLSGFGMDAFGDGELFEGAADAFASDEGAEETEREKQAREEAERKEKERRDAERKLELQKAKQEWSCHLCTYLNPPSRKYCGMCETPRQKLEEKSPASKPHKESAQKELDQPSESDKKQEQAPSAEPTEQVLIKKRKIPMELQRLFARMQVADLDAVSTQSLTESFGWQGREMFEQQDVHELNRVLFDAIERSLKNTPANNLISNLYKGMTVNQIICTNCKNISEREEAFQDVTLPVAGLASVTASLAVVTEYEMLTGDNRYFCEKCGQKVDALKGAVFRSLPPILILSLARFTYDVERDARVKVGDKFAFPLLLDMRPYTEQARAEGKQDATEQLASKLIPIPIVSATVETAAPSTTQSDADEDSKPETATPTQDVGDDNKGKGKRRKKDRKKDAADAKSKQEDEDKESSTQEIEQGPIDPTSPNLYELFSVIIHCGSSAGFGHYHAYIRDVLQTEHTDDNMEANTQTISHPLEEATKPLSAEDRMIKEASRGWYDFNDSTVKPIPVQRLASQYAGRSECAYMLIYRHLPSFTPPRQSSSDSVLANRQMPSIPKHLEEEMQAYNRDLQKERDEYERDRGMIDIMAYHTRHFRILGGQIHKRIAPTTSGSTRFGAEISTAEDSADTKPKQEEKQLFTLSKETTVEKLIKNIKEALGDPEGDPSTMKLDQVEVRGTQLHFSGMSLLLSDVPPDATLETIGIKEGSSLSVVLWDGETIGDEKYDPEAHQITVRITQYKSANEGQAPSGSCDPTVSEFSVRIGDMETIGELKSQIAKETGIPEDKQYLCRIEYQKFTHLAENNISLLHLGIYNESKLTVELQPVGTERSWAWEMFLRRQKLMEIFVTDKCSGEEPYPTITVELDKKATLAELKAAIMSKFPQGLIDLDIKTQLRRSLPGSGEGAVYTDESRTLEEVGVKDGDRVIIEHGDASKHVPMMSLRFVVALSGTKERAVPDPLDIDIPRNATIAKCKELMCAMFDKPVENSRLRRTDIWGGPDRLFDDESRSLEDAKVLEGDLLWLEEGKPPIKGQIEVFFQLYYRRDASPVQNTVDSVSPTPTSTSSNPPTESKKEQSLQSEQAEQGEVPLDTSNERRQILWSLVSPAVHLSRAFPAEVRDAANAPFSVSSLFKLDISRSMTVKELKELLKSKPALDHVPSANHMRLWHQDRLLKNDHWPLKKHHVANYSTVTIEVLDAHETIQEEPVAVTIDGEVVTINESSPGILLYLHKRDSAKRTISFVSSLWFTGDTVDELREEVAKEMGMTPGQVKLIKYLQYNGKWRTLEEEKEETTSARRAEAKHTSESSDVQASDLTQDDNDENEEEDEAHEMIEMDSFAGPTKEPISMEQAEQQEPETQESTRSGDDRAEQLDPETQREEARLIEYAESKAKNTLVVPYEDEGDKQQTVHLPHQQRRKIEGKPYYVKDGDIIVVKEVDGSGADDFETTVCLMSERNFKSGKRKGRRGMKDNEWGKHQPKGGSSARRVVERGIRIDVEEF